jgi:hypothetical protein
MPEVRSIEGFDAPFRQNIDFWVHRADQFTLSMIAAYCLIQAGQTTSKTGRSRVRICYSLFDRLFYINLIINHLKIWNRD